MVLARSAFTVGSFTLLSRLFGFVRDVVMAMMLGAGPISDAFFVAWRLPNMFRALFAEGAFSAGFVPTFSHKLSKENHASALRFAEESLSVLMVVVLGVVVVAEFFMPQLIGLLAPGFGDNPEIFGMAVNFAQMTFVYLIFITLVALLGGVLNSLDHFSYFAAAPVLLNIVLIAVLFGLAPMFENPGTAASIGVVIAGVLQLLWMMFGCYQAKIKIRLIKPSITDDVRSLLRLMGPALLGSGVTQVNTMIGTIVASFLSVGSVSYLWYADRINQLPLGVVGIAMSTALLPLLSRQIGAGDEQAAIHNQNRAMEMAMVLTLPAMIGILFLAAPIIDVLFVRGAFSASDGLRTSYALMGYTLGLPAMVGIKVFTPGFFARHDTKTPVQVAAGALVVNLLLMLFLVRLFGHVGVALAGAGSAWMNMWVLVHILKKRAHYHPDARLSKNLRLIFVASLIMGAVIIGMKDLVGANTILGLVAVMLVAKGAYFGLLHVAGVIKMGEIKKLFTKGAA